MPLLVVAFDKELPPETRRAARDLCQTFATMIGDIVLVADLDSETLDDLRAWTMLKTKGAGLEGVEPALPANAPMSSADFVYLPDGRPDWGAMWGSFCELALYGGPPHRGIDNALGVPAADAPFVVNDVIAELRRGVWETTGLFAEPAPPHWLAVTCHSKQMAAWMAAAIILENVDAKCEDEVLYVPASPDFEIKDQVKSVITVVAKVNHYWQAHAAQSAQSSA